MVCGKFKIVAESNELHRSELTGYQDVGAGLFAGKPAPTEAVTLFLQGMDVGNQVADLGIGKIRPPRHGGIATIFDATVLD